MSLLKNRKPHYLHLAQDEEVAREGLRSGSHRLVYPAVLFRFRLAYPDLVLRAVDRARHVGSIPVEDKLRIVLGV